MEEVGAGKYECSMFPRTTTHVGCPLHIGMNWSSRIYVSMMLALADMCDKSFPTCEADEETVGTIFDAVTEAFQDNGIQCTPKSRYPTGSQALRKWALRVLQNHGSKRSKILNANVCPLFPNGVGMYTPPQGPAQGGAQVQKQCPDIKTLVKFTNSFSGVLHYALEKVHPCEYFKHVADVEMRGCHEQFVYPYEERVDVCAKQCEFVKKSAMALGIVHDVLTPPYRTKRGKCQAYKSTSGHLRLEHLPGDYCALSCQTMVTADAAEAQHISSKLCNTDSSKVNWLKTSRHTAVQQGHLCSLGRSRADIDNEAIYKYQLKKEGARMRKTWKVGRRTMVEGEAQLEKFHQCKVHNKQVLLTRTVVDDKLTIDVTVLNTPCPSHTALNLVWRFRGKTAEIKAYKKQRDDECACVKFYKQEDGHETEVTDFESHWCAYQDRDEITVVNTDGGNDGDDDEADGGDDDDDDDDDQEDRNDRQEQDVEED